MNQFVKKFFSLSFFVESPDYFEGGIFHSEMNNDDYNKQYLAYIYSQLKQLEPFNRYQIFVREHPIYGPENKTYYLVDKGLIEGAIEIETKKENNFCLGVWQRNSNENKGAVRNFFVKYLPKMYKSIVSGKVANKLGMQFWKKLLEHFTKNNLKVTIFSGTCVEEQPYNNTNFEKYWTHVSKDKKTDPTFVSGSDRLFKFYLT